ncbi:MAG TPA: nitroreductase/quinone reductase family protein [Dehalococcoidia bacterium]
MVYKKPNAFTKKMNSFLGWLAARGIAVKRGARLEHKGRVSGKTRMTAVNWTDLDGKRYLVAPRGETQWVRNVRADGGLAVLRRGSRIESVRLEEVPAEARAAIIKQYVGENKIVKGEFGLEPDDAIEKYEGIATNHPTFLIHPA